MKLGGRCVGKAEEVAEGQRGWTCLKYMEACMEFSMNK